MGSWQSSTQYEPEARWAPFSAVARGELYMWGGSMASGKGVDNTVEVFNQVGEIWGSVTSSGDCPPRLQGGASTSFGHNIYVYGGHDGTSFHGSLLALDTMSCKWSKLADPSPGGPMMKRGCGIVAYINKQGNPQLLLFGGIGILTSPLQAGSEWVKDNNNDYGWTNELHTFDLSEGEFVVEQWLTASHGCYAT